MTKANVEKRERKRRKKTSKDKSYTEVNDYKKNEISIGE